MNKGFNKERPICAEEERLPLTPALISMFCTKQASWKLLLRSKSSSVPWFQRSFSQSSLASAKSCWRPSVCSLLDESSFPVPVDCSGHSARHSVAEIWIRLMIQPDCWSCHELKHKMNQNCYWESPVTILMLQRPIISISTVSRIFIPQKCSLLRKPDSHQWHFLDHPSDIKLFNGSHPYHI